MAAARGRSKRRPVSDQDDEAGGQSFLDHLDELRRRIIRSLVAIGIGMLVAFFFAERIVFFLAKMQMVTARFLWRHMKYAILVIFIVAAALTSSTDPWNQAVYAAPMIVLYLISIAIAWIFGPKNEKSADEPEPSTRLRLVIAATVLDQARRSKPGRYPAAVRRT